MATDPINESNIDSYSDVIVEDLVLYIAVNIH